MDLTPFNQGALLAGVADPQARGGVCVALCDRWLSLMKQANARSPEDRMDSLRKTLQASIGYQKTYGELRAAKDRDAARKHMGKKLGLEFEGLTRVEKRLAGEAGMVARLARDVEAPGASMGWTLAFPAGRHAIAAVHNVSSISTNIHRFTLHVFDPNLGEYVGTLQELPAIVADMFRRIPDYRLVTAIDRTEDTSGGAEASAEDRFTW
jgi:hypothetical protein